MNNKNTKDSDASSGFSDDDEDDHTA